MIVNKVTYACAQDIQYQYVTNLLKMMGWIYRGKHPQNNYMQWSFPIATMSIALALHATAKLNP